MVNKPTPEADTSLEARIRTQIKALDVAIEHAKSEVVGLQNQKFALEQILNPEPAPEPAPGGPETPPGTI
jgi:hypothetical protein